MKELCFLVELEHLPQARTLPYPSLVTPLLLRSHFAKEDSVARINRLLHAKNTGLQLHRIKYPDHILNCRFLVFFSITNIEKARDFLRACINVSAAQPHLEAFAGDWYHANVICETFQWELCGGLNDFLKDNGIVWRIRCIQSPGG